jgi:hypothetical protein
MKMLALSAATAMFAASGAAGDTTAAATAPPTACATFLEACHFGAGEKTANCVSGECECKIYYLNI